MRNLDPMILAILVAGFTLLIPGGALFYWAWACEEPNWTSLSCARYESPGFSPVRIAGCPVVEQVPKKVIEIPIIRTIGLALLFNGAVLSACSSMGYVVMRKNDA